MLVSGATKTVRRLADGPLAPALGCLIVPGSGNTPIDPLPWALDNGAFAGFAPGKWVSMLERLQSRAYEALWCTVPDVVADHDGTMRMFGVWAPIVRHFGFRVAFVAQNGCDETTIPWDECDCLFIGGDTHWKLHSHDLIKEAKRRGKWVHVGRVNSFKRLRWAHDAGADSVDGTAVSMFADTHLHRFAEFLLGLSAQTNLFQEQAS